MGRMFMGGSSELGYSECVDAVVFGVGADEFYERDLPTEIECDDESIVPACDFESDTLAIEHLRFRNGALDIIARFPMRGLGQPIPALQRHFGFWMSVPKGDEDVASDDTHCGLDSMFPKREQHSLLSVGAALLPHPLTHTAPR